MSFDSRFLQVKSSIFFLVSISLLLVAGCSPLKAQLDKEFADERNSQNSEFESQRSACLALVGNSRYRFGTRPDTEISYYYTRGRDGASKPFLVKLETWTAASGYFHCNVVRSQADSVVIPGKEFLLQGGNQECRKMFKVEPAETGHPRLLEYTKCGESRTELFSQYNTYMSEDKFRTQENLINAFCFSGKTNEYEYCWNRLNKNVYTRYGMMGL